MSRKAKRWTYRAGRRPHSVTAEEMEPGGNIYVRVWLKAEQKFRYRSLGHRDRKKAIDQAEKLAARLRDGAEAVITGRVTLERIFRLYRAHRTPQKGRESQTSDDRRIEMFGRVLGLGKNPYAVSLHDWESFLSARRNGTIDSYGRKAAKPKPVGERTLQADLAWLTAVFNWAMNWKTPDGAYLLRENPVRGFSSPKEKNPRRPVMTHDRYLKLLAVSDEVMMEVRWSGSPEVRRSYLKPLLVLANGTGRRISAIRQLRYCDLALHAGPHGSIHWPAHTDKMGFGSTVPISEEVCRALEEVLSQRPGIGEAPLFPAPRDYSEPMRYERAVDWLKEAERRAGLKPLRGGLWHTLRRKWATERKHLSNVDVAAAGGWKSPRTLVEVYQQPDAESMYEVVIGGGVLKEA